MDHIKEKLHRIVAHRFDKTETALQKMTDDFTEDHIHDFRVEIKKLKAFVRLVSYGIPEADAPKFPKPLNKLYKALGSLREWQIQKSNIIKAAGELQFTGPLPYIQKIDRKVEESKHKSVALMKKMPDMKKLMDKSKIGDSADPGPATIIGFIQTKAQGVQGILKSGKKDDSSMHEMRKKIKDVQYILSGVAKTGEIDNQNSTLESVQNVSALLGDYHDLCISVVMLKKELKSIRKETAEKKILHKIINNWLTKKQQSRKQTIESTKALIESVFSEQHLN